MEHGQNGIDGKLAKEFKSGRYGLHFHDATNNDKAAYMNGEWERRKGI